MEQLASPAPNAHEEVWIHEAEKGLTRALGSHRKKEFKTWARKKGEAMGRDKSKAKAAL